MSMTDACTNQYNFISPAPSIGGLAVFQNWLNRLKLVRDHTPFQSSCQVCMWQLFLQKRKIKHTIRRLNTPSWQCKISRCFQNITKINVGRNKNKTLIHSRPNILIAFACASNNIINHSSVLQRNLCTSAAKTRFVCIDVEEVLNEPR